MALDGIPTRYEMGHFPQVCVFIAAWLGMSLCHIGRIRIATMTALILLEKGQRKLRQPCLVTNILGRQATYEDLPFGVASGEY